jgi:hypothetical protein
MEWSRTVRNEPGVARSDIELSASRVGRGVIDSRTRARTTAHDSFSFVVVRRCSCQARCPVRSASALTTPIPIPRLQHDIFRSSPSVFHRHRLRYKTRDGSVTPGRNLYGESDVPDAIHVIRVLPIFIVYLVTLDDPTFGNRSISRL